jgi:hypothetical protein
VVHETVHNPDATQAVSGASSAPDNGIEVETPPFIFNAYRDAPPVPCRGDFNAAFFKLIVGESTLDVI